MLPVTALTAIDPFQRDATVMGVLADVPGAVVVRHDLSGAREGRLRRVVSDAGGLVEDVVVELEHVCLSCALREDLLPTLLRLSASGRWSAALLALPLASEPLPVVHALALGAVDGRPLHEHLRLTGVVNVLDGATAVDDLLGNALLAERGMAHADEDRRSVGEVLAHQLRGADLVVAGPIAGAAATLLRHLTLPGALRLAAPEEVTGHQLLADRHDAAASARWEDPRGVRPAGQPDTDGVWTLDLHDWRPLHPGRLLARIEDLGSGRLVSRGRFWLPTRPRTVGIWDGAGGQLSVGEVGSWGGCAPSTRLVVTGVDDDSARVRRAFADVLLTDAELALGLDRWRGRDDGFEAWMGETSEAA